MVDVNATTSDVWRHGKKEWEGQKCWFMRNKLILTGKYIQNKYKIYIIIQIMWKELM